MDVSTVMTAQRRGATQHDVALEVRSVSKTFAGDKALNNASLQVRRGEVHALLGPNGSGKSTMIKVLAGFHVPDAGSEIYVDGEPFKGGVAQESRDAGLRFVHQDLGLIESLTVEENFRLVTDGKLGWRWISDRAEQRKVQAILDSYGATVGAGQLVSELSASQKSIVAIIRATESVNGTKSVLVLDEPTAALPKEEVGDLFRIIDRLKAAGTTMIYVSHRMPEVLQIADRVTVLRDGATVAVAETDELDLAKLVDLVVGNQAARHDVESHHVRDYGPPCLEVRGLRGGRVRDATFHLRKGEILGVTGVLGSGYDQILALVFGAQNPAAGSVLIHGEESVGWRIDRRINKGVAYAPADRKRQGSMPEWTLRENVTLPRPPSESALRWMRKKFEQRDASAWLERMGVDPPRAEKLFATMSGGNQQKVVIGRWLRMGTTVMLLEEPTNGVDAAAKTAIYELLNKSTAQGAAVIMSSSDVEELVLVCDRVLVVGDGVIKEELAHDHMTDASLNAAIVNASHSQSPAASPHHTEDL
jgi:ribose transport system ATP-binding protein